MKNFRAALRKCNAAIKADQSLAIAHITRAQFANQEEDLQKMVLHFEKGLALIDQDGQPLDPPGQLLGSESTIGEVKGDAHCMLAYAYHFSSADFPFSLSFRRCRKILPDKL